MEDRTLLAALIGVYLGESHVAEGGAAEFKIRADRPVLTDTIVQFRTIAGSATAGDDYIATNSQVTLLMGTAEMSVPVSTKSDTVADPGETFALFIDQVLGTDAVVDFWNNTRTAIIDDVAPPSTSSPVSAPVAAPPPVVEMLTARIVGIDKNGNEVQTMDTVERRADTRAKFAVKLSAPAPADGLEIIVAVSGTARQGDDYASIFQLQAIGTLPGIVPTGKAFVPAGSMISSFFYLTPVNDQLVEYDTISGSMAHYEHARFTVVPNPAFPGKYITDGSSLVIKIHDDDRWSWTSSTDQMAFLPVSSTDLTTLPPDWEWAKFYSFAAVTTPSKNRVEGQVFGIFQGEIDRDFWLGDMGWDLTDELFHNEVSVSLDAEFEFDEFTGAIHSTKTEVTGKPEDNQLQADLDIQGTINNDGGLIHTVAMKIGATVGYRGKFTKGGSSTWEMNGSNGGNTSASLEVGIEDLGNLEVGAGNNWSRGFKISRTRLWSADISVNDSRFKETNMMLTLEAKEDTTIWPAGVAQP